MAEFGVIWAEIGRSGRLTFKERIFENEAAREGFAAKVEKKDNFVRFESWLN